MGSKIKDAHVYLLFLLYIICYHAVLQETNGDSLDYFQYQLKIQSLFAFIKMRYLHWSSRIFLEIPLVLLSNNLHITLWKCCNIIICLLTLFSLARLTEYKTNRLLLGLFCCWNFVNMNSAGWLPTTTNYLWPLAFGVTACIPLHDMYRDKTIAPLQMVLYSLCTLYSTNNELFSIFYFCILVYCTVLYLYKDRKKQKKSYTLFLFIQYVIVICNMASLLLCPGNGTRYFDEITTWFPDFPSLTVIDKFTLGYTLTFQHLVKRNALFFVFSAMLFLHALLRHKKCSRDVCIASFPFVLVLVHFFNIKDIGIDALNAASLVAYVPFLLSVLLFFCIIHTFLNTFTLQQGVYLSVIFCAGMLTRLVMGFTPTLYISMFRTFIFLEFALIFCTALIALYSQDDLRRHPTLHTFLQWGFLLFVVIMALDNFHDIP